MSVARLLLSGLLVASGLILGAFTLHGAFAPQLPLLMQASGPPGPAGKAWVTTTRAAAGGAKPVSAATEAKAAAEKARRRQAAKRRAEKRLAEARKLEKAKQQPQQTTFQWPWN